jgi:hypothetical protein
MIAAIRTPRSDLSVGPDDEEIRVYVRGTDDGAGGDD